MVPITYKIATKKHVHNTEIRKLIRTTVRVWHKKSTKKTARQKNSIFSVVDN